METQGKEQVEKMWADIEKNCLKLKILMGGKTGVGKSSIINVLIGSEVSKVSSDGRPCTKANEELLWSTDMGDISITDVPGLGEANAPTINGFDYEENIKLLAKDAHVLLLVLKCDDKALELEEKFLQNWSNDDKLSKIPVFIAINQIDKMKPSKIWDPKNLDLNNPTTEKEKQIRSYVDYVSSLPIFCEYGYAKHIFPVSAGEYDGDQTYGIDRLGNAINKNIPEMLRLIFEREQLSKEEKVKKIISYYAVAAGGAAIQPIPIIDSFILAPIQIAMVIHIGKIYGVRITKSVAGGIVNTLGLSLLGNYLFIIIVSFFPGIKQVIGPAIAYSLTFTSGLIVNELFSTGNLNPTKEQLEALTQKYKGELKAAKSRYENGMN